MATERKGLEDEAARQNAGAVPRRRLSAARKLAYALVPALLLVVGAEVAVRAYYFQRHATHSSGLGMLIEKGRAILRQRKAEQVASAFAADVAASRLRAAQTAAPPPAHEGEAAELDAPAADDLPPAASGDIAEAPSAPSGGANADLETPAAQKEFYARVFGEVVAECRRRNVALHVLHPPDPWTSAEDRDFFAALAKTHDIGFTDMTATFAANPREAVYLLPLDPHLASYGTKLVAEALAVDLAPLLGHRSGLPPKLSAEYWGDYYAYATVLQMPKIPFEGHITPDGFRVNGSTEFDEPAASPPYRRAKSAERARILCVGDSMTFNTYLHDGVTFPAWLSRRLGEADVINAGVPGYTICDEYEYLMQRGFDAAPDVVVLQVLNNDLYGLADHWRSQFCRHKRLHILGEPGRFCFQD